MPAYLRPKKNDPDRKKYGEGESETGGPIVSEVEVDPKYGKQLKEIEPIPRKELKPVPEYKKGGTVKKTGLAKVHKGEVVIPKKKAENMEQFFKRRNKGMRPGIM